jgi:glyoxylase-like metal-dependent hydrolase (beta-lactamase superfamily II)
MERDRIFKHEDLEVLRLRVGPFDNNVYLLRLLGQQRCLLIDAAAEAEAILQEVGSDRLEGIYLTHAHPDHIQALEDLRKHTSAPLAVHPKEPGASSLLAEVFFEDGQRIPVGKRMLEVLYTPGHTPGSVCFLLSPHLCFCGDTVFPGGPGKTWSPEDFRQIIRSLETKIYPLPDHVHLLPGHGDGILVGESRKEYHAFCSRPREKTPWGDVLWETS